MNEKVAKQWIKALRSGKYKQGQSTLKQYNHKGETKHCCLGVLCELYNDTMKKNHKKTLSEKVMNNKEYDFEYGYTRFGNSSGNSSDILPSVVRKWACMNSRIGEFTNKNTEWMQSLVDMNDSGKKFTTIAKTIEKNIDNL